MERLDDAVVWRLVGAIYDAAGGAAPWTAVLETVCDLLGATGAHLLHFDHRQLQTSVAVAARTDPDALDAYGRHFHRLDPWGTRVKPGAFAAETVVVGASLVSFENVRRSEFYAGLGRRYGISRSLIGVIEAPSANRSAIISVNRGDAAEEFDGEAARLIGALVPHLRRALALHRRLAVVRAENDGLAAALDRLRAAIVLVDAARNIVTMNRAADELVARQNGLGIRDRHLRGETSEATAALDRIVTDAIAIAQGRTAAGSVRAALPKRSDGRPLEAVALPLPPGDRAAARAAAAVFVVDPDEAPVVPAEWLTTRFGLTPAEARVASALARGEAVADLAEHLRVTTGTARWYVKQILAKTGTKRQADLVRLLVGMVAGMGGSRGSEGKRLSVPGSRLGGARFFNRVPGSPGVPGFGRFLRPGLSAGRRSRFGFQVPRSRSAAGAHGAHSCRDHRPSRASRASREASRLGCKSTRPITAPGEVAAGTADRE